MHPYRDLTSPKSRTRPKPKPRQGYELRTTKLSGYTLRVRIPRGAPDEVSCVFLFASVGLRMETDPFSSCSTFPPTGDLMLSNRTPHLTFRHSCNHKCRRWLRPWENETMLRGAVEPCLFGRYRLCCLNLYVSRRNVG